MAEVLRIEIPIEVADRTEPEITRAQQKLTNIERAAQRAQERMERMTRPRWQLTLSALDRATPVLERVGGTLRNITGRAWRIGITVASAPLRAIDWVFQRLTSIQGLVAAFLAGKAFQQGVLWPMQVAGGLQQAEIGFRTFLGSQRAALQFMARLQRFAAETPFEMDQLVRFGAQLLPVFRGNVEMVFRTLNAFGDAASLTGAGIEGMGLALLGFRQIAAKGRLSMEELLQVTENLMIPMEPIIQELGIAKDELDQLGRKGIPAARAMEAILRALERPVSRGGFLGGMSAQMDTLNGQVSMLRDNLMQTFVQPWGRGLVEGITPGIREVNDWFSRNRATVESWSATLREAARTAGGWVAERIRGFLTRLQTLTADPTAIEEPVVLTRGRLAAMEAERRRYVERLARAMSPEGDVVVLNRAIRRAIEMGPRTPEPPRRQRSLGEWLSLAWDRLVVQPFEQWWGSGGQEKVRRIAERVGAFLGRGVNSGLMAALGVTGSDGANSPFVQAGTTAGKAFFDGFLSAIDGGKIADRIAQAAGQVVAKAGTVAPGGAPATAGSWLSFGALAWLASRFLFRGRGGGAPGGGGGRRGAFAWLRERMSRRPPEPPAPQRNMRLPWWLKTPEERAMERLPWWLRQSPPAAGPSRLPWWQRARDWVWRRIFPQGRGGRIFRPLRGFWGVGLVSGAGRFLPGPLDLAMDAASILTAEPGAERTQTAGNVIGGVLGGALGAALGSFLPGPGTAIGGFVGQVAGSWLGERVAQPIANLFRRIIPGHVREGMAAAQQEATAGVGQVTSALGALPGQANPILAAFPGLVGTWMGPLAGIMGGAALGAVGRAVGAFGGLPGGVSPHLAAVIGRINAIAPSWFGAAAQAGRALLRGVLGQVTAIPSAVGAAFERVVSRVRAAGASLYQVARNAFQRFVAGYKAGMDEHSPGYIERSMYRIMEVSRATAFAVGSDMQRLAASMGPRMRALHDGIMAAGGVGYGGTVQPPAIRPAVAAPVQEAPAVPVRAAAAAGPVNITVQPASVNITVQVDGGDPERVVQAIEANVKRIAKALADPVAVEIVRAVLQVQANSPRAALA